MEVVISPKYEPLFHLLHAWEYKKSKEYLALPEDKKKYWDDLAKVDEVLLYGGRDSGKTFTESLAIPLAVKDYGHRVIYTRYTMSSTDQSISEALNDRINLLGCSSDFEMANNVYEHVNGGRIFITGQKTSSGNQTAKLKSLENFSMFVTDEAEEIRTYDEWYKIKKSIRAKDVQCISMLVFNPPTREHWLYLEFFEDRGIPEGFCGVFDRTLYIHSTYLDNINNLAEHNIRDYEALRKDYEMYNNLSQNDRELVTPKIKKNWKRYKHVVLGGFLDVAEGVIYEDWVVGEFNESLPYLYGLDFGFNDPDALTKVAVDLNEKKIYIKEIYFQNNTASDQLANILMERVGSSDLIVCDSAQKRLIKDLYYKGLNTKSCRKGRGSVERRIKTIQGFQLIIDPESINVQKALKNYSWHDKRSGVPKHDWSDLCDSFGYAAMDLIEY